MVFSSHIFLFYFLPLVLIAYYALPFRARTALIALASYVFYGWANPWWAVIMFFGSSVDYFCGLALVRLSGLPDVDGLPPVIDRQVKRTRAMKAVLTTSIVLPDARVRAQIAPRGSPTWLTAGKVVTRTSSSGHRLSRA